ncbi:DUF3945 domain-containing protein [Spirosoma aerophilum]
MNADQSNYARSQADGLDNIAPTGLQGQQAWQYAKSDNFFSPEEQAAVMRQQLEPYRQDLEKKLAAVGWSPDQMDKNPSVREDLFSGKQTVPLEVWVTPELKMNGTLRIMMTENGPDIRITPIQPTLALPKNVEGVHLSKSEQAQLTQDGALPRPFLMPEKGEYVPTYLRVNPLTNTVELWRVKAEQLPTRLMGIDLTKDQQMQIAHGHPVRLSGLLDSQGEPFDATVSISASKQSLQFADLSRLDIGLKPGTEFRQQLAQNNEGAKTDLNRSREMAVGSPVISNQQSEAIKELLNIDPQDRTQKLRR